MVELISLSPLHLIHLIRVQYFDLPMLANAALAAIGNTTGDDEKESHADELEELLNDFFCRL